MIGAYEGRSAVGARLLAALPPVTVLRAAEWDSHLVRLLSDEAGRHGPGQEAYLDRLLDLLLIAPNAADLEIVIDRLVGLLGYLDRGERDGGRLLVLETAPEVRVTHLHLLTNDNPRAADYLAFRDALRTSPELRARYQDLKRELRRRHGDDRAAYTAGKAPLIAAVLAETAQKK